MEDRSVYLQCNWWKRREAEQISPKPWAHLAKVFQVRGGFKGDLHGLSFRILAFSDLFQKDLIRRELRINKPTG